MSEQTPATATAAFPRPLLVIPTLPAPANSPVRNAPLAKSSSGLWQRIWRKNRPLLTACATTVVLGAGTACWAFWFADAPTAPDSMPAVAQLEELAEVPISRTPRRVTSASADWQTVSDSAAEEHVRTPFELDHETLDPADRRRVKTAVHITDLQGIPADQLHSISHQNAGAGPSTTEGAWLTGGIEDEIPSAPSPAVYYVRP